MSDGIDGTAAASSNDIGSATAALYVGGVEITDPQLIEIYRQSMAMLDSCRSDREEESKSSRTLVASSSGSDPLGAKAFAAAQSVARARPTGPILVQTATLPTIGAVAGLKESNAQATCGEPRSRPGSSTGALSDP